MSPDFWIRLWYYRNRKSGIPENTAKKRCCKRGVVNIRITRYHDDVRLIDTEYPKFLMGYW